MGDYLVTICFQTNIAWTQERRIMLTVFQDIMFAETPVSSLISSVLPLIFTTKKHAELSLEEVFSMYRQSTKNSFSLLPWLTISFRFWSTVLCWLLKWLGPPHFKQDSPQAGHSFQACMVPHLLQLCLLLQFRAPQPLERDCLPPVEAWFVLRRFVVSASTCCSSILAAPFILTNSLCASSGDGEISRAFCRSSFSFHSSRSFRAGRILFWL